MHLIIITGFPASWKTTLGKRLAHELSLPFLCRDAYKEILFDKLGARDREWSKQLGAASYEILYHETEALLSVGNSLIVETNFHPTFATERFLSLQSKFQFKIFQIRCFADGEVLFERFKKRAFSGERHLGHDDHNNLEEFRFVTQTGKIESLAVWGTLYDLDTTDLDSIDFSKLIEEIRFFLEN